MGILSDASAADKKPATTTITLPKNLVVTPPPKQVQLPGGTRTDMGQPIVTPQAPKPNTCAPNAQSMKDLSKLYQQTQNKDGLGILFIMPVIAKSKEIDKQMNDCKNAPIVKPQPTTISAAKPQPATVNAAKRK
ncbi:MAG: hypothetical protein NTY01_24075 [Verrucomicrobia bacterium]|nr:hypothetical protein [Verrucomicrobiota bacterium]